MKERFVRYLLAASLLMFSVSCFSQTVTRKPAFHVLVLTEKGGIHEGFVLAALDWLGHFSAEQNFDFTVINNTDSINDAYLAKCQVFIQLNYPPYMWTDQAKAAFIKYMEEGRGGWGGFSHGSPSGGFFACSIVV